MLITSIAPSGAGARKRKPAQPWKSGAYAPRKRPEISVGFQPRKSLAARYSRLATALLRLRRHLLLRNLPLRLRPLPLLIPPIMKCLVRPLFLHPSSLHPQKCGRPNSRSVILSGACRRAKRIGMRSRKIPIPSTLAAGNASTARPWPTHFFFEGNYTQSATGRDAGDRYPSVVTSDLVIHSPYRRSY